MKEEFMIERQGKRMVLFAGLLDEAHSRGLREIDTFLHQIPSAENGNVAVVLATVVMDDEKKFTGIGDASPENVGRNIAPHLIRMAETRAKARALRDAINVGVTAYEEIGGPGTEDEPVHDGKRYRAERKSGPRPVEQGGQPYIEGGSLPPTEKQLRYLKGLVNEYADMEKFEKAIDKPFSALTRQEVSDWISRLGGRAS